MKKVILFLMMQLGLSQLAFSANFFVPNEINGRPILDHGDATIIGSLQHYLNRARPGDHVILSRDETYFLKSRLRVHHGVTLRGKHNMGMQSQKLQAANGFPEDFSMVQVQSGTASYMTTLSNLWIDGDHKAWRIVDSVPGGSRMAIFNSKLEKTKNDFTMPDGGPYRSPYLSAHTYQLSVIYFMNNDEVNISGNTIQYAGLNEVSGKMNGMSWLGFADGIKTHGASNLVIRNNNIKNTLTGGIRLSGGRFITVENNRIAWVARNVEWTDYENSFLPPFSDGITGHHNQARLKKYFGSPDLKLHWSITNNRIYHSGNNGIHVGGKRITLSGNKIGHTVRRGVVVGDWRSDIFPPECNRNISIFHNIVRNTGEYLNTNFKWRIPNSLQPFDDTRHGANIYIDHFDKTVRVSSNTMDDTDEPLFYHISDHKIFDKSNCR